MLLQVQVLDKPDELGCDFDLGDKRGGRWTISGKTICGDISDISAKDHSVLEVEGCARSNGPLFGSHEEHS